MQTTEPAVHRGCSITLVADFYTGGFTAVTTAAGCDIISSDLSAYQAVKKIKVKIDEVLDEYN